MVEHLQPRLRDRVLRWRGTAWRPRTAAAGRCRTRSTRPVASRRRCSAASVISTAPPASAAAAPRPWVRALASSSRGSWAWAGMAFIVAPCAAQAEQSASASASRAGIAIMRAIPDDPHDRFAPHRFIFAAIPKTGTHSVRRHCASIWAGRHRAGRPVRQQAVSVRRTGADPARPPEPAQVRPFLGEDVFAAISSSPSCAIRSIASSRIAPS